MIYDQGIQPRSVRVIKVSNFEDPKRLGELAHHALKARLFSHSVVAVGLQVPDSVEAQAFLQALGYQTVDLVNSPYEPTIEQTKSLLRTNQKVALLMSPNDAIHFRREALIHKTERDLGVDLLSFVFVHLPGSKGVATYEDCQRQERYTHTIGCLLEDKEKIFRGGRRKIDWSKFVGTMEQEGQRTFMVYSKYPSD